MPRRERRYRVIVDGPAPADLGERCAATWCELLEVVEHNRALQRHASEHGAHAIQDDLGEDASGDREPVDAVR